MDLDTFLNKNKISILPEFKDLCERGEEVMKKSIDSFHNEQHVYSILNNLDKFIKSHKDILRKIDFNVLLPSIFWHDVWRSLRRPNKHLIKVIFDAWYEGFGSYLIFKRSFRKDKSKSDLLPKIAYVIRKHSRLQFLRRKSLESKILFDLDTLGVYSMRRLEVIKKQFTGEKKLNKRNYAFFKFITKFDLERKTGRVFYFDWSKEDFLRKKKVFLARVYDYLKEFEKFLGI